MLIDSLDLTPQSPGGLYIKDLRCYVDHDLVPDKRNVGRGTRG